jgi:hypothetical protein
MPMIAAISKEASLNIVAEIKIKTQNSTTHGHKSNLLQTYE